MLGYLLGRGLRRGGGGGGVVVGGGGGANAWAAAVAAAWVRNFSSSGRKRAENVRKINPRVNPQEASSIARNLYHVIHQHGPLTISNAWLYAQEAGVSGLSSKTHLKLMLKWMRGRKMLKLLCNEVGSTKKFLLSTLPEDPKAKAEADGSENSAVETKLQTKKKKPSLKAPKKKKSKKSR